MKTKFFHFFSISPLRLTILIAALMICIWACAGSPPSDESKPADTKQPSIETKSSPPSSTSSSRVQPAKESPATVSPSQPVEVDIHLIITGKTALRAEPKSKSKIVAKLKKGEKVVRLSASGSWYKVELSDQTTGWVLKMHTREEK